MSRISPDPVGTIGSTRSNLPTITVVVVNLNGLDLLGPCLDSLVAQTYPADQVEIILIDNASTDGSVSFVRKNHPRVRVLVNDANVGFSPAINQAATVASGEYLALINNDATADPNWLIEAARHLQAHEEVGCVASLILRDDKETIDYAGSAMAFNGMGYAQHVLEDAARAPDYSQKTLFASGGAMLTRTATFLDVGGFDDTYFAFFEDVDYGWRLWVMGHETHFVPASIVYHRHHGTIKRFGYARERYLLERNAMATLFKNYGDENLATALPPAVLLTLMRALGDTQDGDVLPDFTITPDAKNLDDETFAISALTAAHIAALRDFGRDLQSLKSKREQIQARRVTSDDEILRLFKETLRPSVPGRGYKEAWEAIEEIFGLEDKLTNPTKVLIITGDLLSPKMAGPAIRAYEMATSLMLAGFDVTLGSQSEPGIAGRTVGDRQFRVLNASVPGAIGPYLAETDIVVFQGFVMHDLPEIEHFDGPVVVDIYDPFHLENLTSRQFDLDWFRQATHRSDTEVLNSQLRRGDFFLCASEKQRDFWLGQLSGLHRINPATYDADESLRSLIDIAPFGLPAGPPIISEPGAIRANTEGIEDDDFVMLWGGGIYNWFDPLTLIRAVHQLIADHPKIKLFFLGSAHPNPDTPHLAMAGRAYRLAEQLGMLGTHVFFKDGWVEYDERQNYFVDADVGVSTHYEHLETRYSFRTRILDYIWCELPIIATSGDTLSALVDERGLGLTVPPEDVDGCADAIRRLYTEDALFKQCVANLGDLKPDMTWDNAMAPLIEFCRNPRRAPDAQGLRSEYIRGLREPVPRVVAGDSPLGYVSAFVQATRRDGLSAALEYSRNIIRHRLNS